MAKEYNVVGDGVATVRDVNSDEASGGSCDKVRAQFIAPRAMIK
jgi:hypothetical protein